MQDREYEYPRTLPLGKWVNRGNLPPSGSRPAIFGTTRTITVVLRENVSGDPPAPMRAWFPESFLADRGIEP
jgi:hypothetical protein